MPAGLPIRFRDENAARKHLEALQWPDGPVCPHCGVLGRSSRIQGGRPGLLFCGDCRQQFTVTVGTVFERSKVPLHTWLYATHLLCSSKKGISSHQLSRMLGVTYKTAWFMTHRIREAMKPAEGSEPPLGGQGQVVEADEAELGKSSKSRSKGRKHNLKFVSLIERGGRVRSRKITGKDRPITLDINAALYANVDPASVLHTDGAKHYRYTKFNLTHEAVDHNQQFVRDGKLAPRVHTNSAEGYFSVFKRGLVGTYQHMSEQHLERYLAEFDFRMSHRAKLGYTDDMRTDKALSGIGGKRLTYRRINSTQDPQAANA
jgi:transposase-like protein